MKRILTTISFLLITLAAGAQSVTLLSGNLNISSMPTANGNGTFNVTGTFSDPKGLFFPSDIDTAMIMWKGNEFYVIDSLIDVSANPVTFRVNDVNNTGFIATGNAAVLELTPNLKLPAAPPTGDSNASLATPPDYSAIVSYIVERIEQEVGNLADGNGIYSGSGSVGSVSATLNPGAVFGFYYNSGAPGLGMIDGSEIGLYSPNQFNSFRLRDNNISISAGNGGDVNLLASGAITMYGAYDFPNFIPGANQVMSWPTPTTPAFTSPNDLVVTDPTTAGDNSLQVVLTNLQPDGDGIKDPDTGLPGQDVTIQANGNTLEIDSLTQYGIDLGPIDAIDYFSSGIVGYGFSDKFYIFDTEEVVTGVGIGDAAGNPLPYMFGINNTSGKGALFLADIYEAGIFSQDASAPKVTIKPHTGDIDIISEEGNVSISTNISGNIMINPAGTIRYYNKYNFANATPSSNQILSWPTPSAPTFIDPNDLIVTDPTTSGDASLQVVLDNINNSGGDGNGIYSGDGSLTGMTTVNQASNALRFQLGSTGSFNILGSADNGGAGLGISNSGFMGKARLRLSGFGGGAFDITHGNSSSVFASDHSFFFNTGGSGSELGITSSAVNPLVDLSLSTGGILDKDGEIGSAGNILSSTGSQVDWLIPNDLVVTDPTTAGDTSLQVVLANLQPDGDGIKDPVTGLPNVNVDIDADANGTPHSFIIRDMSLLNFFTETGGTAQGRLFMSRLNAQPTFLAQTNPADTGDYAQVVLDFDGITKFESSSPILLRSKVNIDVEGRADYKTDYSGSFTDRSIPDVAHVKNLIAGSILQYLQNNLPDTLSPSVSDVLYIDMQSDDGVVGGTTTLYLSPENLSPGAKLMLKVLDADGNDLTLDSTTGGFITDTPGLSPNATISFNTQRTDMTLVWIGTDWLVFE